MSAIGGACRRSAATGGLAGELGAQQRAGDLQSDGRVGGGCLGSAQPRVVLAGGGDGQENASVGVDLQQGDAGVSAPTNGLQADVTGVTEDDDSLNLPLSTGQSAFAAVFAEAVADEKVTAVDGEREAVAVGDQHGLLSAVPGEDARGGGSSGAVGHYEKGTLL